MIKVTHYNTELVCELIFAYCEAKSFLWNCFFGWRKTVYIPKNGDRCYFILPHKKYYLLCEMAENFENKIKK